MREEVKIGETVHAELLNWARWCWQGEWPHPLPPTHCGSLESGYRAPPDWNPDDEPQPLTIKPNARHAQIVQAVWEKLDQPARLVLKAEYPARAESGRARSRAEAAYYLAMPQWLYDTFLLQALKEVEAAIAVRA